VSDYPFESTDQLERLRREEITILLREIVNLLRSNTYVVASISKLESVSLGTDLVEFRLRLALRSGAPPPGDSKERKDV
jgi:hypothetical protein